MSAEAFTLERFVTAQESVYPAALAELRAGQKRTHWMWFIFPQLAGLAHSPTSRFFAIASLAEARAYLDHPTLGPRLRESVAAALACGRSADAVFGYPDALKFRSSMTLFERADPAVALFTEAIVRMCAGEPDPATLRLII